MRYYEPQPEESRADDEQEKNNRPGNLNKSQKIAVAVLAFFALFIIIFWSISFKNSLSQPFAGGTKEAELPIGSSASNTQDNSQEALKSKDTDGDGLSDWDELYFYKTSPYLADSDSDGINDKAEVDNGTDPNCPEGRDCYDNALLNSDKAVTPTSTVSSQFLDSKSNGTDTVTNNSQVNPGNNAQNLDNLDPAQIRQLLLVNGMDKNILDQISDEDLVNGFQDVLNGQ